MRFLKIGAIVTFLSLPPFRADAQSPTGSILHVEIVNSTLYHRGYCSVADAGRNPNKLSSMVTPFVTGVGVGDIVSVNGQAVKGVALELIPSVVFSSTFTPGSAIADITLAPTGSTWDLTFLKLDGTLIGAVRIAGNGGGPPPPGAPKEIADSGWTVVGGTGAFFGTRGYWSAVQDSVSKERKTTDCEDPAYRRINADAGGNKRHGVLWLVPLVQPQVLTVSN